MNTDLRDRLLAMAAEDRRVRAELAADGSLGDGYHPCMEEVHRRNAAALTAIIDEHGWPGRGLVGEDGAHAAWFVSSSTPSATRRCNAASESSCKRLPTRARLAAGE